MLKVGDKLLCIQSSSYTVTPNCEKGIIYTIIDVEITDRNRIFYKIDDGSNEFEENSTYFRYFITQKQLRKQKLNKLKIYEIEN